MTDDRTASTRASRPAAPAASSATRPAAGGSICGAARSAGTSAAATPRPASTPPAHFRDTGHPLVRSFEPGEELVLELRDDGDVRGGPAPGSPRSHPADQPTPGPRGGCRRTGPTVWGRRRASVPGLAADPLQRIARRTGAHPPRSAPRPPSAPRVRATLPPRRRPAASIRCVIRSWRCRWGCQRASRSTAEAMAWKPASLGCRPSL